MQEQITQVCSKISENQEEFDSDRLIGLEGEREMSIKIHILTCNVIDSVIQRSKVSMLKNVWNMLESWFEVEHLV